MSYQDPWAWMDQQKPAVQTVPNTVTYQQQPEAQPIQHVQEQQDPLTGLVTGIAMNRGANQMINAADAGINYKAPLSQYSIATPATNAGLSAGAPQAGIALAPAAESSLAVAGTAPAVLGAEAAGGGLTAATLTGAPMGAAAAGGAGEAMMGAMGPVGWGMLGLMAAKRLKLF
jgi:hypothetical protein